MILCLPKRTDHDRQRDSNYSYVEHVFMFNPGQGSLISWQYTEEKRINYIFHASHVRYNTTAYRDKGAGMESGGQYPLHHTRIWKSCALRFFQRSLRYIEVSLPSISLNIPGLTPAQGELLVSRHHVYMLPSRWERKKTYQVLQYARKKYIPY